MADNDNPSGDVVELTDSADFEDEAPAGIVTDTLRVSASANSVEELSQHLDSSSDQSSRDTIQDVPRSSMYRDTDSDASSDDDYFHDAVAGSEAEHVGGDNVQASEEMAQDTVTSVDESVAHPGESPSELVDAINGMYRILDLVGEEGSGGFIDKIVIAQESFGRFVNSIYPGAYTSMTKINFAALDHMDVRPIGLYGSKSELVRYLIEVGVVDDEIAQKLLKASNEGETSLRSGMYLVNAPSTDLIYALYWPEETTWNDNASASVVRNRVTFMRYLTKICDQVVCFLSDEHAETLVWEDESESAVNELDDEMDRLFAFRVSKTNEKEENVVARDGFLVFRSGISCPAFHQNMPIDPQLLMPRLVLGETVSGFMTASYRPTRKSSAEKQDKYQLVLLRSQIQAGKIRIGDVDEDSLNILISAGLASRVPDAFDRFRRARAAFDEEIAMRKLEEGKRLAEQQKSLLPRLMLGVKYARAKAVLRVFKSFDISLVLKEAMEEDMDALVDLLKATYPGYGEFYDSTAVTEKIPRPTFHTLKAKLLLLYDCFSSRPSLTPKERHRLSELSYGELLERQSAPESSSKGGFRAVFSLVSGAAAYIVIGSTQKSSPKETTPSKTSEDSDAVFLEKLARMVDTFPELANTAVEAREIAEDFIKTRIEEKTAAIASSFQEPEKKQLETHLRLEQARREQEVFQRTRHDLITAFNSQLVGHSTNYIEVTSLRPSRSSKDTFSIEGREKRIQPAAIEYAVEVLQLTEDDRVAMWQDDRHVPRPKLSSGRGSTIMFELPVTRRLRHIQLLPNKICLLVVSNDQGETGIFVDNYADIPNAVNRWRHKKKIHQDKMGSEFLIAFNETKRMLAILAKEKMQIHVFIVDEHYSTIQGFGGILDLKPWYGPQHKIEHLAFRCGSFEELVIVDNTARARIYSITAMQFRPAVLQLSRVPTAIASSPDGSCLLTVEPSDSGSYGPILRMYHWVSFGSTPGIVLEAQGFASDSAILTSFVKPSLVYCLWLDLSAHHLRSLALNISHKVTALSFQEDNVGTRNGTAKKRTVHNCLVDCHTDVWTKFPVVPAVARQTVKSSSARQHKSLVYVSALQPHLFPKHHNELIASFEKTTRKPVDNQLSQVNVTGMTFAAYMKHYMKPSTFCAGEWLVEILCLIPIHIAIARDNRFIPLKDGIFSMDSERSLLGATVEQIADRLSFGWYESIFQSYMASKPVKVVSSMGEQSVGKSYMLNHLVDTSFAGSAMRTTEGVWMSVTPTNEELIVALDFEGVHSIERSVQEDCLLVLFNTALSNLVLFRNNYAFSRDITGLFQSFQSSSIVLDPAANPTLFQSSLVVIIKDVPDSDKHEIKNEFQLKFSHIVEVEGEANFLSRLHGDAVLIVPWPVIESRQFYTLFPQLKKLLDKQTITHPKAGIFLQTVKMLMAKLKANDWGSIDQSMASHRVRQLFDILPTAMKHGATEIEHGFEPLRDIDNGQEISIADTDVSFQIDYLTSTEESYQMLDVLQQSWPRFPSRHEAEEEDWVLGLGNYLLQLADDRTTHVQEWLTTNTSRFGNDTADFASLHREFEALAVALKAGVILCQLKCAECNLMCLRGKHHGGQHDCRTDHVCAHDCNYIEEHDQHVPCGLPAGHSGTHVCNISEHLCGERCEFFGKRGCLERCSKTVNHEDEGHHCPAKSHGCGEPCMLQNIRLHDGSIYTCHELCRFPSNEPHTEHFCQIVSCPIRCQLCKRLCSSGEHLHGLDHTVEHLCGEEHPCPALCASEGICRIETAPQSVEATFTGRHETFQYTKYTQVAKPLQCAISIPPWRTQHHGTHVHSQEANVFHFCEARCDGCGYYCTLPRGHVQQLHETSHGSMSRTRWAVEDNSSVEVNGRRFGTNDDGAPMMCSMVCRNIGRHVHIEFCRAEHAEPCQGADLQHISSPMAPEPNRAKDFVSHSLHWARLCFKDPYTQEEQLDFTLCDALCAGTEHQASVDGAPISPPSFCTLPLFHPHHLPAEPVQGTAVQGYISHDGHHFGCTDPSRLQQTYHIIFVIDRSSSMSNTDRRPLEATPMTARIAERHNNRLGAVYQSLFGFWSARQGLGHGPRQDAYSVILFNQHVHHAVIHDTTSTAEELLNNILRYEPGFGTNFTLAIEAGQARMEDQWDNDRASVMIFLSDGECRLPERRISQLCRRAVNLGRPLSFHAVSFGPFSHTLQGMVRIATQTQNSAPHNPLRPTVPSSYHEALDTVQLAETFLGIAESLRKTRGALMWM